MKQARRIEKVSKIKIKHCRQVSLTHGMFSGEMFSIREYLRRFGKTLPTVKGNESPEEQGASAN
jgi:hypothetical protein